MLTFVPLTLPFFSPPPSSPLPLIVGQRCLEWQSTRPAGAAGGREGGRRGYLLRIGSREIFTVVFPLAAQPLPAAMFFLVRGLITSGEALGDLPMGPHFQSFR